MAVPCEPLVNGSAAKISAVILDLDGTLLDTERATKEIFKEFLARYGKEWDREVEDKRILGMTQKESSALIIRNYDLPLTTQQFIQEITPLYKQKWADAKPLPGANRLIKHLYDHKIPFALASNSFRENIDGKISHHEGWKEMFPVILGSDEVKEGKPAPYLFEEAAKRLGVDPEVCVVIEDSLVGVKAAKAAKMKVVAIPAHGEHECSSLADVVLHSLLEFHPEQWGLPPFKDWVDQILPIEPIYLTGLNVNGLMSELTVDGPLPDQVIGLYCGWVELNLVKSIKVIVSIGWNKSCCSPKRKLDICIVDDNNTDLSGQQIQLLLVGYIRDSTSKKITSMDSEELEEYKSIVNASLDLPKFVNYNFSTTLHPESSNL